MAATAAARSKHLPARELHTRPHQTQSNYDSVRADDLCKVVTNPPAADPYAVRVALYSLQFLTHLHALTPANRVAVALGLENTSATLEKLRVLEGRIGLAEIRLDLMKEFDLEELIAGSPCPLVITCRAVREGGSYRGSEEQRLDILRAARALGCAYVDVEWDCAEEFGKEGGPTKVISSRHFHDSMPADIHARYEDMRRYADVVKLVGLAREPAEALPILELLARAESPVIGIAMGAAGLITRLMAPCFEACLLTYAAAGEDDGTAPGQISIDMMTDHFGVHRVGPDSAVDVYMYFETAREAEAVAACRCVNDRLKVPLFVEKHQADSMRRALENLTPRVRVSVL